jgi:carboxypeptidase Taq
MLGLDVPDDAQGCLQDIHWSHGSMGYFPTYALGNLYAAQLFETMNAQIPEMAAQIRNGDFKSLLEWLRKKVHHLGRRRTAPEIVAGASGKEPGAQPWLHYLRTKYSAFSDISL